MDYKLELKIRSAKSGLVEKVTKKFDSKHVLAEFLVNLCERVYINYNSGTDENSEYVVGDGRYEQWTGFSAKHVLESDNKLIDFCMKKYGDLIRINNQTNSYFNSPDVPRYCEGCGYIEEEHYKKACRYLTLQNTRRRGNEN